VSRARAVDGSAAVLTLAVALLAGACGGTRPEPFAPAPPSAYLVPSSHDVPVVEVTDVHGTPAELVLVAKGVMRLNRVMASACFRDGVLAATFTETGGLSSAQVWARLVERKVVLRIAFYTGGFWANHWHKTIGKENDATPGDVFANRYFIDSPYMVAFNLVHEGEGHTQGFRHDGVKRTSVPYTLERIFRACDRQLGE
jgi:hypothetical protein